MFGSDAHSEHPHSIHRSYEGLAALSKKKTDEPVEPGPRPQDLSSTYMMLAGIGLTMIVILVMVFQRKQRM